MIFGSVLFKGNSIVKKEVNGAIYSKAAEVTLEQGEIRSTWVHLLSYILEYNEEKCSRRNFLLGTTRSKKGTVRVNSGVSSNSLEATWLENVDVERKEVGYVKTGRAFLDEIPNLSAVDYTAFVNLAAKEAYLFHWYISQPSAGV